MNMVKRSALWGAITGTTIAAIAMYIYLNTATVEVKAAEADGFPLWSWYEVPFIIPEAAVGGTVGAIVGLVVAWRRSWRARRELDR